MQLLNIAVQYIMNCLPKFKKYTRNMVDQFYYALSIVLLQTVFGFYATRPNQILYMFEIARKVRLSESRLA